MAGDTMRLAIGTILSFGLIVLSPGDAFQTLTRAMTQTGMVSPTLVGTITAADGKPLEGVVVSARKANSTITQSVFTDAAGEFLFPPLGGGAYDVWAQATGFDAARAQLTLDPGRTIRHAFTMQPLADVTMQLTGSEWLESLPSATKEQRRMKELVRVNCGLCHTTSVIFQQKFDEVGWNAIVEFMAQRHVQGPPQRLGLNRWSTIKYHQAEIAKYLASVRGPESPPLKYVVHPRPSGEATRVLMTEFNIPASNEPDSLSWYDANNWQGGTGTTGAFPGAVHDVVVDNDGNAWMNSIYQNSGRIAVKLNVNTGQATAFGAPGVTGGGRIYIDPPGKYLWLDVRVRGQQGLSAGRIDIANGTFETFTPPQGMSNGFQIQIAPDSRGNVWLASQHGGIHLNPSTRLFRFFPDATLQDGMTYGIATDSRGNGWLAKYGADKIGFVDIETGKVSEIEMRPPWLKTDEDVLTASDREAYAKLGVGTWGGINQVPGRQAPRRLNYDPKADVIWVANNHGQNIVSIDAKTRKPTYYKVPLEAHPYRVDVDKDSNAYTAMLLDDAVLKLNPSTKQWTTYRLPTNGCEARSIFVDRRRTEVWIPCDRAARVIRMQFRTPAQLQALKGAAR